MKKIFYVLAQIYLIISLSFFVSYSLRDPSEVIEIKIGPNGLGVYEKVVRFVFGDKNIVSAQSLGVYTCVEGNDGSKCQEYSVSSQADINSCNDICSSDCLPTSRDNVAECELGTCFDPVEGTCQENSPKGVCESFEGEWYEDNLGNIPQCKQGCCVLGDQTKFIREQECLRQQSILGTGGEFRPEVDNELACLALSNLNSEGACVFNREGDTNTCKFVTKDSCNSLGGEFFENTLCSNPELETECTPQERTACVDGKDEVYWFDSCGNRENIYSTPKSSSYNDGYILSSDENCQLEIVNGEIRNQESCGNCNYLLGTTCGPETSDQQASIGDYVCIDMRCRDTNGNVREHGESWCEYQSKTGEDIVNNRAMDTPGAQHYRATCLDGEVVIDPCQNYRNEICVESQTPKESGGTFSSAACRINTWQVCLQYNSEQESNLEEIQEEQTRIRAARDDFEKQITNLDETDLGEIENTWENWYDTQVATSSGAYNDLFSSNKDSLSAKCSQNPDCFLKTVDVDDQFKFNMCVPKYSPGFDFNSLGTSSENICSLGTQECTWVEVKTLFSGWKCKVNCGCKEPEFVEEMNDLCMSLGDCGSSVNYMNDEGIGGYSVKGDMGKEENKKLSSNYLIGLSQYSNPTKGYYIDASRSLFSLAGTLGTPSGLGSVGEGVDTYDEVIGGVGQISGALGTLLIASVHYGIGTSVLSLVGLVGSSAGTAGTTAAYTGIGTSGASAAGASSAPSFTALGGAFAGAAMGLAVVTMLLQWTGVAAGLPEGLIYSLMGAGAVAGASIGQGLVAGSSSAGGFFGGAGGGFLGVAGPVVAIVVVVVIIVLSLLGIGKTKEHTVKFTCDPWQPPLGGENCEECGSDGLPCTRYNCQSLGQTCDIVNEGTGEELCINVAPNDVSAPKITPGQNSGEEGGINTDITDRGFRISSGNPGGCFTEYDLVDISLEFDEPSQCKYDEELKSSFEQMSNPFGSNLFRFTQTETISVPSLIRLGESDVGPDRRSDYELFIRCRDKTGNENIGEYSVSFCVEPGNDVSAPVIKSHTPELEDIAKNTEKLDLRVNINEPAECKWSLSDSIYDLMPNQMVCNNGIDQRTIFGWSCYSSIPTPEDDTNVYVRCIDQPWLRGTEDEGDRNVATNSYSVVYRKTDTPLSIDVVKPNNQTLTFGSEPVTINLELETSGGLDGTASCYYKWGDGTIRFLQTDSRSHKQPFESFTRGEREIYVYCEDGVGNLAEATAKFKIEIDEGAPKITRAYELNSDLVIVTDEVSSCGYVKGLNLDENNACNFRLSDANITLMSGNNKIHKTNFDRDDTYYIKCEDNFGNYAGNCGIIVSGGVV